MTDGTLLAKDWGWKYAGRDGWACQGISLRVEPGERVLLLGASGSGKSTFLQAVAGVLGGSDEGTEAGSLLIGGRHPTRLRGHVGLVLQDPESQVILSRVGDDVAFGPENLQVERESIWRRVRKALSDVNLELALDHPTAQLSGGQKQRMAIAGALALFGDDTDAPGILCLDEPTANLDPASIADVRDAIARLTADRAMTLLVVEHRVSIWADLVDRVIVLGAGGGVIADGPVDEVLREQRDELTRAGVWVPGVDIDITPRAGLAATDPVLWADGLTTGHVADHPVGVGLDVSIPTARSTVIIGPNGVGKSTLALTLAGLLEPLAGRVQAAERLRPTAGDRRVARRGRKPVDLASPHAWRSKELLTRIGTVFQSPEHQFVESTVRRELAVGLRALEWAPDAIDRHVDELLERLHLTALADANPFSLSGGEQRRLSVGTVLATSPEVIVLDEPTFGQDRNTWLDLVMLIREILDEQRTIISVTHDDAYLRVLSEHVIDLGARS